MAHDLRNKLEIDLIVAQKSKDQPMVGTLRFLLSAIKYREVDKRAELSDAEVIEVVTKQVKTHKESIEAFQKGGRADLVEKEQTELRILESYLPAQLSEEEIRQRVTRKFEELKSSGQMVGFGTLMKSVMVDLKGQALRSGSGQADGSLVKRIVEEILSSNH